MNAIHFSTRFALVAALVASLAAGLWSGMPVIASAPESQAPAVSLPEDIPDDWWAAVQEEIRLAEYNVTWQEATTLPDAPAGAYQAPNRAQGLRTTFTADGPVVVPRTAVGGWRLGLHLAGWGWSAALQPPGTAVLAAEGNRLAYSYAGGLVEWYVNREQGLEQGFTLPAPAGAGEWLVVELAINTGDLTARLSTDGAAIEFCDTGGAPVLRYGGLAGRDAAGRVLPTALALSPASITISVHALDAVFPISVDPILTGLGAAAAWTAEGDQATAYFGYAVGTAGDVNGDGFADVIVGAYYYDNGEDNEGRAFVYHGSASGLGTAAAWTAESNQAAAWFGYSVGTAGDVNGDGFADIIVAAPQYDGGQGNEGGAFVYHGSAGGLVAAAAWTAESNQAGAQFGYAAGTAGDVNGDGYADVIVGALYYDNPEGDEGRAFVYYGSATGLNTTAAWTAESDQSIAYFGNAVGTAGDVNGDGYADVIVAAYAYDNGSTDEGRAYVYHGSATGLNTTAAWTAESDQANARFGNAAGTAGDVNGDGYADVIVGAYSYSGGQAGEGRAFVYHGSATGLNTTAAWTAESDQANARFGTSAGTAGDVNGDGYADIIVGAFQASNGETYEGRAFVYHGSAAGLAATATWTAESNQASAYFGCAAGTAGDVNGDGYADVIVGAYYYDNGEDNEGRAFVYHGSASGLNTTAAWTAESNQTGAYFGLVVGTAGDVNGDGFADVIVAAQNYDNGQGDEGGAFVYHGSATGLSTTAAWTAESNQASASFGYAAGTAGDVNGDGYADVIVGAQLYDDGEMNEGQAYVYLGSSGGLNTTAAWSATGNQVSAFFGGAVGTAGDVNGDGYADVIVGAPVYDNGATDEGQVFVYYGSAGGLSTTATWTAESNQAYASFGASAGTAGDVNGDGYADVIVGAYQYDNGQGNEGGAFVYHGSAGGLGATAAWTAESDQANAQFGNVVRTAGDVNGDGYADVIVAAFNYDGGETDEGRAYVYHGSAAGLSTTAAWTAESNQASANFGNAAGTAGDVNGDGYADVIVGAPQYDNGEADEGRAYVYHGSASGLSSAADWTAESDQASARFGRAAGTAGDVNGDGYADVIVGAFYYTNGQTNEGRVYVYYGNASDGLELQLQQRRSDDISPVASGGQTISPTQVRLAALARTPAGRSQVRLEWEVKPEGTAFSGAGLGGSAWQDSGTAGRAFDELVSSLAFETRYHWRLRIVGRPANAVANSAVTYRSRWLYGSTFFTALSGEQAIGGTGQTNLLGQAAYVDMTGLGSPALNNLTLRGYPQTAHAREAAHSGGAAQVLDRYFSVTPNSGAAGYGSSLCLNYDDAEVTAAGVTETALSLCRWTGAAWICHARAAESDTAANLVCADGVISFSDWVMAAGCTADAAAQPAVTVTRSGADVALTWGADPNSVQYQVWASTDPYFDPDSVPPVYTGVTSYTDTGAAASLENHFYIVRGLNACGAASTSSNRAGEFTFGLTPGTL